MAKENVLANSDMSDDELWDLYEEIKDDMGIRSEDLDAIFEVAMSDRENLFPNQNKDSEEKCLKSWINSFIQSRENLPSSHIGEAKKTCSDPALAEIVKIACRLDEDEIEEMEKAHNLFMSAENIQGELLEEYIAKNVEDSGGYGVQAIPSEQSISAKEMVRHCYRSKTRIIRKIVPVVLLERVRKLKNGTALKRKRKRQNLSLRMNGIS